MQIFFTDSKHTRQHDYLKLETRLLEPVYLTVIDLSSTKHRFLLLNHPCTGWFIQLDDKPLVNGLSCEKNTYTDRRNKLHHAKYFIPDIPRITRWVQQKLRRSTLVNRETFVETVYGGRAEEILRFIKFRSRNSAIHSLLYSRTTSGVPERLMVEYHPVHRMKARDRDRDWDRVGETIIKTKADTCTVYNLGTRWSRFYISSLVNPSLGLSFFTLCTRSMVGKVGFDIGGRAAASGNDVTRVQKRMKKLNDPLRHLRRLTTTFFSLDSVATAARLKELRFRN